MTLAVVALVALLAVLIAPSAFAQTTYTWNKTASASWATSSNWTPVRTTPATNDILVFNGASTATCIVTAVPQQTIGRLRFIGNVNATLSAAAAVTLTISGATNPALDLTAGSTVTLAGSGTTPITLSMGTTSTALIAGNLNFTNQAHVLTSTVASAIQFNSPAVFTAGTSFSGSPFGTTGTANVVVFNSGSTYTNTAGNGPWGLAAPSSRVVFNSGSKQIWRATAGIQTSGRTFANLTVQNNTALSAAGTGDFAVDTLTVESGSSFTHTGSSTAKVTILGDLLSAGTGAIGITPGSGNIQLSGGKLQTIAGGGSGTVTFGGSAVIAAGTTLAASRTLTFSTGGMTVNGAFQFNQGGAITGGSTWTYGAGASLLFAQTSATFTASSSSTFWPAVSGPTNVTVPTAGLTMNAGATRTIAGTLNASGPIVGANLLTLPGTFQLNTGASVAAAPIYSGTATLLYNAAFTVGPEWGAGSAVGSGVPSHVTVVAGAGTLTMPNTDRTVPGNLTITSGTMLMNAGAGNLALGGNWADTGTFTSNGRTVTFTGAATQSLSRTGGETFTTLVLNKSGGSLVLGSAVTCTPAGSAQSLTFNGTVDVLNLSGQTLTLNGPVGGTDAASTLTGSATSNLAINSTLGGSFGTLRFTAAAQSLGAFTVNLSGASPVLALATPLTVNGAFTLTSGVVSPGANVVSIAPTGSIARTSGWVSGTLLQRAATGAPALSYPIGTATAYTPVSLAFASVTVAGDVSATTTTGDHPNIATSGLNAAKSVNRYWTLANSGATFTTVNATFNFVAGDLDAGVLTDSVEVREFAASAWSAPAMGARTATSTVATGITTLGAFAIAEPTSWTITASSGANGAISPTGVVTLRDGGSVTFTALPNVGYNINNYVVDSVTQGAAATYTFTNVTANHTIVVNYIVKTFTLTLLSNGNGTVTPDHAGPYPYHSIVVITATPALGNTFTGFTQDVSYPTTPCGFPVDSNMSVVANFQRSPMQYTRSSLPGSFTAISTASGAVKLFAAADDSTQTVPLPFPFTFSGLTFTASNFLAINANGFAYFSRDPLTASNPSMATNSNLFNASAPNTMLAPWYDDLNVAAVGTNPAGSVLVQTQGSAGTRTMTVQWTNVSSNNTTTGGQPRRINFQLVLFEASQAIEFRYGTVAGATYSNLESASLGIEDSIGGNGYYIDGATGSRYTNNGMLTTNRWPSRNIRFTPGNPSPLTAGTYTVGSGQTYVSLTDAVADLNQRGVAGPVTFQLTDAAYDTSGAGGSNFFPVLIGPVAGTSPSNTVLIQGSGSTTISSRGTEAGNCGTQSLATAISSTNEPVVSLVGCDYVTLKNVALSGGVTLDRGVLVLPSSLTDGSQNNTLHTVSITLKRTNTGSIGLQSAVPSAPGSLAGTNSYNHYYNMNIQNCYAGMSLTGNSNLFDDGNVVSVADGGTTTIGGGAAGDIGNGTPSTFGIRAANQSNATISFCSVRNMLGTSVGSVDGIALDNLPASNLTSGLCTIAYNSVYGLTSTATNAGRVTGIRVNLTTEPASVSRIFNNFVYNLNSASTVTATRRLVGIMVQDGGTGTGATHNVDFNTVRLQPSAVTFSNSCYEVSSVGPVVNTRDNIFANFTGTQSVSAKHYTWVSPASGQLGAAGSVSDYNLLYLANSANGFTGLSGGDRALLSDWQAITANDAHSQNGDPQFVAPTDPHINASLPTPVAQAGSYLAGAINWVPNDIDFQNRDGLNPDIGADEGVFQALTANDISASSFVDPVDGATKNVNVAFSPQVQFSNTGTSPQTSIPVRYQIRGPLPATTLVYDQGTTIGSLIVGATQTLTFPAVTLVAAGNYEIRASASLVGDQNSLNDVKTGTLDLSGPLNGTYSVGAGQPYPFNTLTNAITRIGAVGLTGQVVYQLVSSTYSAGEVFPINLNTIPNASAVNTFTLRPAPGGTATVSGSSIRALLVLNGADYVTIDGSSSVGGTTRDLTFLNTSATSSSAVVWGQTNGADPATNNTIKNVILSGIDRLTTLFGVGFGGSTIALKSSGTANINNKVLNCDIRRVQYGVYSSGASAANKNTGTIIRGNVIGSNPSDAPGQGGVYVRFEDGISIDHNKLGSMTTPSSLPVFGISLGLSAVSSATWSEDEVTNATVSHNTIIGVAQTSALGLGAGGIIVAEALSGITTIYNNMIAGVVSPANDPDITVGILVGGGAGSTSRVYFNSVSMTGARGAAAAGSFCLAIGGANPVVDARNNAFFTNQSSTGPGDAYLIGLNYLSPYTKLTSDYNDGFFLSGSQYAVTGGFGNSPDGDLSALANWRTATSKDAHTLAVDPQFVTLTGNLHVSSVSSPIVRAGVPIAGITDDIDGDAGLRTSQPVIGCDEFVTYSITTSFTGSGSVAKSPDLPGYVSGSVIQMQAFPSGHYHFLGWGGDLAGLANPQNITMNANKNISATFALDSFTVALTAQPGGAAAIAPAQAPYPYGTPVSLTATPVTGYHFTSWTGDTATTLNPYPFILTGNRSEEAGFAINTYTMTTSGASNGSVTRTPSLATYDHGTTVTLTAVPAAGYRFAGWTGDTTGTPNPLAVVMTRNRAIQGTFILETYTLAVTVVGPGSVSKAPDLALYDAFTTATLTATPAEGYHLVGWSGDTTATTNPLPLPMTGNRAVTATFIINQYAVSLTTLGGGSAAMAPVLALYDHGTPLTLTATPDAGQSFTGWTGDTTAAANPLSMTVTRPLALVASFTAAVNVAVVGSGSVAKSPDLVAYTLGSRVQLTATPITGWHFVAWSGDTAAAANPLMLSLPTSRNLTATFAINTYTLTQVVVGSGSAAAAPQQATYDHGTLVQLTATPDAGNAFVGWSGDASGSSSPFPLTMDGNKTVTATFTYTLAITAAGLGSVDIAPNQANYAPGTAVTLTAQPQAHVHFVGWSGDTTASSASLPLVITRNRALTATFVVDTQTLSAVRVGSGSIAKSPDQASYDYGTPVTLTATPGTGYHFVGWSGDTATTDNPISIAVTGNRNVTGTFAINSYVLNVAAGTGGSAVNSPIQATYDHGTQVTLTATPSVGYLFGSWAGDTASSDNPFVFRMVGDRTLSAQFVPKQYPLTNNPVGNGAVIRSPDLPTYAYGSAVTLTAVPSPGWHFTAWSGDTATSTNPLNFVMTGARVINPVFDFDTYALTVNITGSGSVARSPDQPLYPFNTTVDLTAVPAPGFKLNTWGGAASGSAPTVSVIMSTPKTVTALFDTANYTLSATATGPGSVGVSLVKATYRYPDLVTLTATPSAHAHFVGWTGDTSASGNPLAITMAANRTLVAVFALDQFTVTSAVSGNGAVIRNPDLTVYDYGAPLVLSASANALWHFTSWTGDTTTTSNPLNLIVTRNRSVTAVFDLTFYPLTVNIVGPGVVLKDPDQTTYLEGTVVSLIGVPVPGAHFVSWTGDASGLKDATSVTMNAPRVVTATFAGEAYTLSTQIVGLGSIVKTPDQASYVYGAAVKLTAVPADTSRHFQRWGGFVDGTQDTQTVIIRNNSLAKATFVSNLYTVTVLTEGTGIVTQLPSSSLIYYGANKLITGSPGTGFQLEGWHGDVVSIFNPIVFRADSNMTVTCRFVAAPAPVMNVTIVGSGTVARSPNLASYPPSSNCVLTATPLAGWHFQNWSGDGLVWADNPLSLFMDRDKNIVATFSPDGYDLSTPIVGSGAVIRLPNQASFSPNTAVLVTAQANAGSHFVAWAGDTAAPGGAMNLTMNRNRNVMAQFGHTLSQGVSPVGQWQATPSGGLYVQGAVVQLKAKPVRGYHFDHWAGDTTAITATLPVVMWMDKTIAPIYLRNHYPVSLRSEGSGSVSKAPDSLSYAFGTPVTLYATPVAGWHFTNWSEELTDFVNSTDVDACDICHAATSNPVHITVNDNHLIVAHFELDPFPVLLVSDGGGTVISTYTPQPGPDSTITVEAVAADGFAFAAWEGDARDQPNPLTLKLSGPATFKARFAATTAAAVEPPAGRTLAVLALAPVSPNPAQGRTRFSFSLPRACKVRMDVLDVQGRETELLVEGEMAAGQHQVEWAGGSGRSAPPVGIFFVRLKTADGVLTRRFVMTR